MHKSIEPAILYFGTPVVLVSSENEDGSTNVAPMSSAWWLGWSCLLGFGARSKTPANILRTGECVLNLPSVDQVAPSTAWRAPPASNPVPPHKVAMGYRHEPDKLGTGGLTPRALRAGGAAAAARVPGAARSRARGGAPDPRGERPGARRQAGRARGRIVPRPRRGDAAHGRHQRPHRPAIVAAADHELLPVLRPRRRRSTRSRLAEIPESAYRPARGLSRSLRKRRWREAKARGAMEHLVANSKGRCAGVLL